MKQAIKVGDKQRICTETCSVDGVVTDVMQVDTDIQKGQLVTFKVENYGQTAGFYIPDGSVLEAQVEGRRNRSGMPKEYVYKFAKNFNWNLYGEDMEIQKKIVNNFVVNFEKFRKGRTRPIYLFKGKRQRQDTVGLLHCE